MRGWAALLIGWLWILVATIIFEGRVEPGLVVVALLLGGWLGWQWIRRRAAAFQMILGPAELWIREAAPGSTAVEVPRHAAGALLAAESGLDWRERLIVLTDEEGQELVRFRAGLASVQVRDTAGATESWWRSNMPPMTSPRTPPSVVSAVALLGAWWPRPDQRWSVRGSFGARRPWREGDLAGYDAWDRRQRRQNGLVLALLLLFVYGLTIVGAWPLTLADAVTYLPPGVTGLVLATRMALP
jgi:hypothetical protein